MKKTLLLSLLSLSLLLALISCEGPEGPVGPEGPEGDPGGKVTYFTGTIGGDGSMSLVDIGSGPLPPKTTVTVYYAFPDFPDVFFELGQPTGDNSVLRDPWCGVDYQNADVGFFNCPPDWPYKIIVFIPTSSAAFVKPLEYLFGE